MKTPFVSKMLLLLGAGIAVGVGVLTGCGKQRQEVTGSGEVGPTMAAPTPAYAPEGACRRCHAAQADPFARSAHALTSSLPGAKTMKGRTVAPGNALESLDRLVTISTDECDGGYQQTATVRAGDVISQRTERVGLIVGSGKKAQTYLYWQEDRLYELPASWWVAAGQWMNSPGYRDGTARFDRGASDRCLECHATSFVAKGSTRNAFVRESIAPGITCQKCHGPGAEHVAAKERGDHSREGHGIINPGRLSRDRQMDLCRLCHSGVGVPLSPPLSYVAGDVLENHLQFRSLSLEQELDVHGSQVPALMRSACYQKSGTLTCTTCHDVHVAQRDIKAMAQNCRSCHQVESCGKFGEIGVALADRCIDCHMPLQQTSRIVLRAEGGRVQPMVRNHTIGIHSER